MPDLEAVLGPLRRLAKTHQARLEADGARITDQLETVLEQLQDRAVEQGKKLVEARLGGRDAEVEIRRDAIRDIGLKVEGAGTDALLDAADAVRERWKGFVQGAFGVLEDLVLNAPLGR